MTLDLKTALRTCKLFVCIMSSEKTDLIIIDDAHSTFRKLLLRQVMFSTRKTQHQAEVVQTKSL